MKNLKELEEKQRFPSGARKPSRTTIVGEIMGFPAGAMRTSPKTEALGDGALARVRRIGGGTELLL